MKYLVSSIKIMVIVFFLYATYSMLNTPVSAQQVSLSLSPPLLELFIKPGKSIMVAYRLENIGDPTFLSFKVLPFEAKDNLGNIRIKTEFEGPVKFSLDNADLKLDQTVFLKTKESQQILLRIRVPENIPDGDYYYTLLAETNPTTASEGIGSARARATIGSNILITISNSGNVDIKPKITSFSTINGFSLGKNFKLFDSLSKIPIVLTLRNDGKNMMKPEGEINLKGYFGALAKYDIIPKNILAGSERLIEATPSAQIDCDKVRDKACLVSTSMILSGFFIGKYNLSTQIMFGENTPVVFGSTNFYAFPFKILLGITLASVIVVFIIKTRKNSD